MLNTYSIWSWPDCKCIKPFIAGKGYRVHFSSYKLGQSLNTEYLIYHCLVFLVSKYIVQISPFNVFLIINDVVNSSTYLKMLSINTLDQNLYRLLITFVQLLEKSFITCSSSVHFFLSFS